MKKIVLSALVLVTLAACGKGGAEKYVGYWQEKDDKYVRIVEIKKEGGQYFLGWCPKKYAACLFSNSN